MSFASRIHACCAAALLAGAIDASLQPSVAAERSVLARIIADDDALRPRPALRGPILPGDETPTVRPIVRRVASDDDGSGGFEPALDAETSSEPSSADDSDQSLAPATSNFKEWQKRADEKLQLENAAPKYEHPLAKDNPADFITVCEAGCRGRVNEIVSRVARPLKAKPDAAANQSSFEPTLSNEFPDGAAPAAIENSMDAATIRCEAGCYGAPKIHKARLPRTSSLRAPSRVRLAAARRVLISPQGAENGAIVGPRFAHFADHASTVNGTARSAKIASKQRRSDAWRARRVPSVRPRTFVELSY
jgi:hypothetical protein